MIAMPRSRDPLVLAAAILIHAAGLLSADAIARRASRLGHDPWLAALDELAEAGANEARPIEIDILSDPPAIPQSSEATAQAGVAAAIPIHAPPSPLGYTGQRQAAQAPPETEPGPTVEPTPAPSPTASDPGWLPNDQPDRAPGLNGTPVWAIPGVLTAPTAATNTKPLVPRAPRANKAATKDAAEQQKQTALFPGAGALASALADEVASSSAPLTSESRFQITLDAQGRIVSALFLSASEGDRAAWERIARALSKRFAGKTMPMPAAYAGGATVYVTVSSRVTMPDGTSHGVPTPRGPLEKAPPNEYGRIDSPLNDRFGSSAVNTAPAPNTVTVGIPFKFDLANLGGSRRRVVRAQVQAVPIPAAAP